MMVGSLVQFEFSILEKYYTKDKALLHFTFRTSAARSDISIYLTYNSFADIYIEKYLFLRKRTGCSA